MNNSIVNFRDELSNLKEESKKIMRELSILKQGNLPKERPKSKRSSDPTDSSVPNNISQITSITSTIIDSIDKIKYLIDYIKENDKFFNFKELKLWYRGSRDGDKTKTCHKLCDKKPNVLIIIKSNNYFYFWWLFENRI